MEKELNERQMQIIDSAIKLIGAQGIQGLTIKNLAAEVGFTESAIYRHFESKTQLLVAVLTFLKNNIVKNYSEILNEKLSPPEKLKKMIQQHIRFFNDNPYLTIVLFSDGMYKNEPELSRMVMSIMKFVKSSFTLVLEDGMKHKCFRKDISSEHLSFIIMGSIRLTINQWGLSDYKYKLLPKGEELCQTLAKILTV
jgi:TetR/AcrR family transcriptional regulator, fatty acid metabolism regulator protein